VNYLYRIEMITGSDGEERTDGRYPLRKGCIVNITHLQSGEVMILEYIKDNKGNPKEGYLRTSLVDDYEDYVSVVTVYTMNSGYYLKKL
jgi:hypothetical protein